MKSISRIFQNLKTFENSCNKQYKINQDIPFAFFGMFHFSQGITIKLMLLQLLYTKHNYVLKTFLNDVLWFSVFLIIVNERFFLYYQNILSKLKASFLIVTSNNVPFSYVFLLIVVNRNQFNIFILKGGYSIFMTFSQSNEK